MRQHLVASLASQASDTGFLGLANSDEALQLCIPTLMHALRLSTGVHPDTSPDPTSFLAIASGLLDVLPGKAILEQLVPFFSGLLSSGETPVVICTALLESELLPWTHRAIGLHAYLQVETPQKPFSGLRFWVFLK